MATISKYQTSTGATLYRVRYRTPDNRQTDRRGFTTKRDAQAFAEQIEVDKRRGLYVAPSDGRVKFGDLAREWLDSKHNLKPSTRARYEVTLTVALAGFRDVPIGDITRPMVRALVADLVNSGAAASSVHKAVGLVRQVLATAVTDNRLAANPADGVELPTVRMTEQRFLTAAELHRLALAAGEHKPLVYVLGTTGLRFGEAAELRWRDVDIAGLRLRVTRSVTFVGGRAVVGTPKNGKDRTVALPALVAAMLMPGADDDLVFPDSAGGWMRASNVRRRWWVKALDAAGLPADFKLHELRHTAASLAIRSGANVKALQNMLGHASAGLTLDRYGHLYDSDVDAVGHAINATITESCGQIVGTAVGGGRHLHAVSTADLQ
ncbi:tyrosine-type recombinase/integrase [Mycolicibacterium austroafricanum]|uniref:tyrosine-type recombinase/integrase n=1 Tax=Mycolicibacterium austroafricanum TaxID=39687 RepID=UPI001CA3213A|nr:tyrosine-type recombinase/integrase [Mycolicibacterium austroafricanum]QZT60938.1 site-specific integrase [Mycolicibacterium austroafricanum]